MSRKKQPVEKKVVHSYVIWTEEHGIKGSTDFSAEGLRFALRSAGEKGKVFLRTTVTTFEEV